MIPAARRALATVRKCLAADRVVVLPHFAQRMDQRGMVWGDVLAVFDAPREFRDAGLDDFDRSKWIARGVAADGLGVEIVGVLDRDEAGDLTVFITIY